MGPNDTRCAIWALGELFFFSFLHFIDTYQSFIVYLGSKLRYGKQGDW